MTSNGKSYIIQSYLYYIKAFSVITKKIFNFDLSGSWRPKFIGILLAFGGQTEANIEMPLHTKLFILSRYATLHSEKFLYHVNFPRSHDLPLAILGYQTGTFYRLQSCDIGTSLEHRDWQVNFLKENYFEISIGSRAMMRF